MFGSMYEGRRVLVTGHTGFKGSWLVYWLKRLGAEVKGIALAPEGEFSHAALLGQLDNFEACDICDSTRVESVFADFKPEIVFHLAAQPIVRLSYKAPVKTFATNVMGTVNILEAVRKTESVKTVVAVSSDKCYENKEQIWGYREDDAMGGYDPYSASKGCMELVVSSYRRSFFNPDDYGRAHGVLLASARAGNVIGGGDWAEDRLIPDLMKAAASGREVTIRSPQAVRPWQHVLEPLGGYLLLGQKLLEGIKEFATGWNFGPAGNELITVRETVEAMAREWPAIKADMHQASDISGQRMHEAGILYLDCSKARHFLKWHGAWLPHEAFSRTAQWYKDFYQKGILDTEKDWEAYIIKAEQENMEWTR